MSDRRDLLIELNRSFQPDIDGYSQYTDWVGTDDVLAIRVRCEYDASTLPGTYATLIQEAMDFDPDHPNEAYYSDLTASTPVGSDLSAPATEVPLTLRWFRFAFVYDAGPSHAPPPVTFKVTARKIS
jgi:hypothetical protein